MALCGPGKDLSPDPKSASALTLDLPASRTVQNKFVVYNPLVHGILLQQPERTKTQAKVSHEELS